MLIVLYLNIKNHKRRFDMAFFKVLLRSVLREEFIVEASSKVEANEIFSDGGHEAVDEAIVDSNFEIGDACETFEDAFKSVVIM